MIQRISHAPIWLPWALVTLAFGLAAVASTQLTDGWVEIPDHWWSTFAVGGPLGLAGLTLIARRRRR